MKTAVSIPDPLFKRAETLARRQRQSRSRLYATALEQYLDRHGNDAEITRKLNEVYSQLDSRLPPELKSQPSRVLGRDDW